MCAWPNSVAPLPEAADDDLCVSRVSRRAAICKIRPTTNTVGNTYYIIMIIMCIIMCLRAAAAAAAGERRKLLSRLIKKKFSNSHFSISNIIHYYELVTLSISLILENATRPIIIKTMMIIILFITCCYSKSLTLFYYQEYLV